MTALKVLRTKVTATINGKHVAFNFRYAQCVFVTSAFIDHAYAIFFMQTGMVDPQHMALGRIKHRDAAKRPVND